MTNVTKWLHPHEAELYESEVFATSPTEKAVYESLAECRRLMDEAQEAYSENWLDEWFKDNQVEIAMVISGLPRIEEPQQPATTQEGK